MADFLQYSIGGLPAGCVYALLAVGLVLIYKTTGVFNLAFGAQALLSAVVFYNLNQPTPDGNGWPTWAAFLVSVVVVAPLFGLALDRFIFRNLRTASWQVKLVSALGFVIAIPEIVKLDPKVDFPPALQWVLDYPLAFLQPIFLTKDGGKNAEGLLGATGRNKIERLGGLNIESFGITWDELLTVVVTIAVVVGLALLFRYTAIGLQMRAVVESPRMLELAGVDSDRVSAFAWMLSSLLAGMAGVLLLAVKPQLDPNAYTILVVTAVAAATFGRLSSIPRTFLGGVILGVAASLFTGYSDSIMSAIGIEGNTADLLRTGIAASIPFLLLFGTLVFSPSLRGRRELTDPLSGVDPPPPAPAVSQLTGNLKLMNRVVFGVFLAAIVAMVVFQPSWEIPGDFSKPQFWLGFSGGAWTSKIIETLVVATIFLSITAFTGLSGQLSLATATFAGIGAFGVAHFGDRVGIDPTISLMLGATVAAVLGVLLAVPALRLGGIFLTLLTLAFGLFFSEVVFKLDVVTGGVEDPVRALRPDGFSGDRAWFFYVFAVFAIAGALVILVREGTTGRFLAALRGSEVAGTAVGINSTVARIVLFGFSSFVAGLGGALFAMHLNTGLDANLAQNEFPVLLSVVFLVLVLNTAPRTVDGAVNGAFGFVVFLAILSEQLGFPVGVGLILFGFGAITYARHPEGVAEFQKRISIQRILDRMKMAREEKELRAVGALPPEVSSVRVAQVLSLLTLGVYTTYLVGKWYRQVRRIRGRGLGGSYGLMVYIPLRIAGIVVMLGVLTSATRVSTFSPEASPFAVAFCWIVLVVVAGLVAPFSLTAFLLPGEINKLYVERHLTPPISWRAGLGSVIPALVLLIAPPGVNSEFDFVAGITYFGTFLLVALSIGGFVGWVGGIQQALNKYWIEEAAAARGIAPLDAPVPEPDADAPAFPDGATGAPGPILGGAT